MQNERILQPGEYLIPTSRMRIYRDDGTAERDVMLYQILKRPTAERDAQGDISANDAPKCSICGRELTAEELEYYGAACEDCERDAMNDHTDERDDAEKIEPLGYAAGENNTPIFRDREHARAYYSQFEHTVKYGLVDTLVNMAKLQSDTQN